MDIAQCGVPRFDCMLADNHRGTAKPAHLYMFLEPAGTLQEADAFPAGKVSQAAIQCSESKQAAEGGFALWAPRLLLIYCPVQDATRCKEKCGCEQLCKAFSLLLLLCDWPLKLGLNIYRLYTT